MSKFKALVRTMVRYDLRDWYTLFFTFVFPAGLLIALVLSLRNSVPGQDLTGEISSNVLVFGAAFVGIFTGGSHLAVWRENGMFTVLRSFPISSNTVISAQAATGTMFLMGQTSLVFVISLVLGTQPVATAPLALIPIILGYLLFFMLGVLLGILLPSMAAVSMAAVGMVIPLGYAGGAMLPVDMLPQWVQAIAPYTPIYHMGQATAMPLIGLGTWSNTGIGLAYLLGVTLVLTYIAQRIMRWK